VPGNLGSEIQRNLDTSTIFTIAVVVFALTFWVRCRAAARQAWALLDIAHRRKFW
jgi:hypothetical protein